MQDRQSPPDLREAPADAIRATSGQNESTPEITDEELRAAAMAALSEGRMGDAQAATAELARRELLRGLKPKRAKLRRIK